MKSRKDANVTLDTDREGIFSDKSLLALTVQVCSREQEGAC